MISIELYMELKQAGYSAEEIKAYSNGIPTENKPEQKTEEAKPEQKIEEAKPEQKTEEVKPEQNYPNNVDILNEILNAVRTNNINNSNMPNNERTVDDILAEIINPKGKKFEREV